jgi:hypothetical protein
VSTVRAVIREYHGEQVNPDELLFGLIIIGPPGPDGKSNLILRTVRDQVDTLLEQTPIARAEIYQRLRELVDEFAMFVEAPGPPNV